MRIFDASAFTKMEADVAQVFAASDHASFFNIARWFELIVKFGTKPGRQIQLALDDSGTSALPFVREFAARTILSCTNAYTCEHSVIGSPESPSTVQNFAKDLAHEVRRSRSIRLDGFAPDTPFFSALIGGFRKGGFVAKPHLGWVTRFENTVDVGFGEYLGRRPSILRNTWHRKFAHLAKTTQSSFQVYDKSESIDDFVDVYQDVHNRSWKGPELFPEFMPNLIKMAAAENAVRAGVLRIDGKPAAAQFWIVWHGRAVIFKLAYAEDFASYSPGTLLTMHMLQRVLDVDRPIEISFGRGDDSYKTLWMSSRREYWGIEAANPRTLGGAALALRLSGGLGRDLLKRRFGSSK